MSSKIDYNTVSNAISIMNSVASDNFSSMNFLLDNLYTVLATEDSLHDCFSEGLQAIEQLEMKTTSANQKYVS